MSWLARHWSPSPRLTSSSSKTLFKVMYYCQTASPKPRLGPQLIMQHVWVVAAARNCQGGRLVLVSICAQLWDRSHVLHHLSVALPCIPVKGVGSMEKIAGMCRARSPELVVTNWPSTIPRFGSWVDGLCVQVATDLPQKEGARRPGKRSEGLIQDTGHARPRRLCIACAYRPLQTAASVR